MNEKQIVWHAYHAGSLCQLVDLKARQVEIEETKPECELPIRRLLMRPVIGQLPKEFITACKIETAVREASWEVRKAARERQETSYVKHKVEIERLHAIECPGCPWDGETIFPMTTRYRFR